MCVGIAKTDRAHDRPERCHVLGGSRRHDDFVAQTTNAFDRGSYRGDGQSVKLTDGGSRDY